jgi:hypothetical protein
MITKLHIKYPMGAGGGWLHKTLSHYQFNQNHYDYFHFKSNKSWISYSHDNSTIGSQVTFSGRYKFNFFCNHIFKHCHLTEHRYQKSPYNTWFKEAVAISFGLCAWCNYVDNPYFDFDDLLHKPNIFLSKINNLQLINNEFVVSKNYFDHSRNLFLASCVDTSTYFNNFDSPWWIIFVLGQLMDQELYPAFDIGDQNNFSRVKKFVCDNISRCPEFTNWSNPAGANMNIILPEFNTTVF